MPQPTTEESGAPPETHEDQELRRADATPPRAQEARTIYALHKHYVLTPLGQFEKSRVLVLMNF